MPFNQIHWTQRGFTLIELLVVIAIISLLVSILLPSLQKAKGLAQATVCAAKQRAIGQAFAFYLGDNQGKYPPVINNTGRDDDGNGNPDPYPAGGARSRPLMQLLDYLPGPGNVDNPLSSSAFNNDSFVCSIAAENFKLISPDDIVWTYSLSHAYMYRLDENRPWAGRDRYESQRASFYSRPSDTYMLTDGAQIDQTSGFGSRGDNTSISHIDVFVLHLWNSVSMYEDLPPTEPDWYRYVLTPHLDASNVLYFDGHVQSVSFDSLRPDAAMGCWETN